MNNKCLLKVNKENLFQFILLHLFKQAVPDMRLYFCKLNIYQINYENWLFVPIN